MHCYLLATIITVVEKTFKITQLWWSSDGDCVKGTKSGNSPSAGGVSERKSVWVCVSVCVCVWEAQSVPLFYYNTFQHLHMAMVRQTAISAHFRWACFIDSHFPFSVTTAWQPATWPLRKLRQPSRQPHWQAWRDRGKGVLNRDEIKWLSRAKRNTKD